jgi:hypothetical protein
MKTEGPTKECEQQDFKIGDKVRLVSIKGTPEYTALRQNGTVSNVTKGRVVVIWGIENPRPWEVRPTAHSPFSLEKIGQR